MNQFKKYSFKQIDDISGNTGFFRIKVIENIEEGFLKENNLIFGESNASLVEIFRLKTSDEKIVYVLGSPEQFTQFIKKYEISYFNNWQMNNKNKQKVYWNENITYDGQYFRALEGVYFEIKYAILDDGNMLALIDNISVIFGSIDEIAGKIIDFEVFDEVIDIKIELLMYVKDIERYSFIKRIQHKNKEYYNVSLNKMFIPRHLYFIPGASLKLRVSHYGMKPIFCDMVLNLIENVSILKISKTDGLVELEVIDQKNKERYVVRISEENFPFVSLIQKNFIMDMYLDFNEIVFRYGKNILFDVNYKESIRGISEESIFLKGIIEKLK